MSGLSLQDSTDNLYLEDDIVWSDDPNTAYFASVIERKVLKRMASGKRGDDSLVGNSTKEDIMEAPSRGCLEAQWLQMNNHPVAGSETNVNAQEFPSLFELQPTAAQNLTRDNEGPTAAAMPAEPINESTEPKPPEFIFFQRWGEAGCKPPPGIIDPRYIRARQRRRRQVRLILLILCLLFIGALATVFVSVARKVREGNVSSSAMGASYTIAPSPVNTSTLVPKKTMATTSFPTFAPSSNETTPSNGDPPPETLSPSAPPPPTMLPTVVEVATSPPSASPSPPITPAPSSPSASPSPRLTPAPSTRLTTAPTPQAKVGKTDLPQSTQAPTLQPSTLQPSTLQPSTQPSGSGQTKVPSKPSKKPTLRPTNLKTSFPSSQPSITSPEPVTTPPSQPPTQHPSVASTRTPTQVPTPATPLPTNAPSASTPAPTAITVAPTTAIERVRSFILQSSPESENSLSDTSSPQYQAMVWLSTDSYFSKGAGPKSHFRWVLATLYYSTAGSQWTNSDKWLSDSDECSWFTSNSGNQNCNGAGYLADLELNENNLVGTLPPELYLFSDNLVRLNLGNNTLDGALPVEFGRLKGLVSMQLSGNRLTGAIPKEIGDMTGLIALQLNENRFTGPIPPEIGNLVNLNTLGLYNNQLQGTIPATFGQLVTLKILNLQENIITGTMPTELALLTNLEELTCTSNNMTGSVSDGVCSLHLSLLEVDCTTMDCSCCTNCESTTTVTTEGGVTTWWHNWTYFHWSSSEPSDHPN